MLKNKIAFIAALAIAPGIVPAENESLKVVVRSGAVLRTSASITSKSLGSVPYGEVVTALPSNDVNFLEIFGLGGRWQKVTYNTKTGWIFAPLLDSPAANFSYVIADGMAMKIDNALFAAGSPKDFKNKSAMVGKAMWTRCLLGQYFDGTACKGEPHVYQADAVMRSPANTPCASLTLDKKKWRAAKITELKLLKNSVLVPDLINVAAPAVWSAEGNSGGAEEYQYYVDPTTWESSGSFVRDGYLLCIAK